jgi:hypothetical protein
MAKISQSLFDSTSRTLGAEKYYKVIIKRPSTEEYIEGYMQEGLSLDFSPEYTTLGAAIPLLGTVAGKMEALSILESPLMFGGAHTQKMYNGSSHLGISLKLKVVDETGNGLPIEYARILASWCQPLDFDAFKTDLSDKIGTVTKSLKQATDAGKNVIENYKNKTAMSNIIADLESDASAALNTLTSLTRMALKVKIGDFFESKNFVMTSLSQNFSYEQGLSGPLWIDFDIKLETLKVVTASEIKTYFYNNKDSSAIRSDRVKFVE